MHTLLGISRAIDAINTRIGKTVAWAIVVAILVSSINAIIRRIFGVSSNAWLELQWYLFGAVFMLCAPWTLKVNEHIRIDIISNLLSKRKRDWIDLLGHIFFLLPFVGLMIYLSVPFFWQSYLSGEVSSNSGGLIIWPAKGLILLGFCLLGLQWFSEVVKRIAIMRGDLVDDAPQHSPETEAERLLRELGNPVSPDQGEAPGDGIR